MLLSVIVPVYNDCPAVIDAVNEAALIDTFPLECEIVVVCKNGGDKLPENLTNAAAEMTRFYSCPADAGKGTAVRIGLCVARGQIILLQDTDALLDPSEYHDMLAPIITGETSVVYGSRFMHRAKGIESMRRLANIVLTKTSNFLLGTRLTDVATPYKVFTAEVAEELSLRSNSYDIEQEITARIAQAGFDIVEVPVSYRPRMKKRTRDRSWQDGIRSLKKIYQCRVSNPDL